MQSEDLESSGLYWLPEQEEEEAGVLGSSLVHLGSSLWLVRTSWSWRIYLGLSAGLCQVYLSTSAFKVLWLLCSNICT